MKASIFVALAHADGALVSTCYREELTTAAVLATVERRRQDMFLTQPSPPSLSPPASPGSLPMQEEPPEPFGLTAVSGVRFAPRRLHGRALRRRLQPMPLRGAYSHDELAASRALRLTASQPRLLPRGTQWTLGMDNRWRVVERPQRQRDFWTDQDLEAMPMQPRRAVGDAGWPDVTPRMASLDGGGVPAASRRKKF